jgi:nitrite reductase/ring-hydroxylating ferredoxin subunit
MFISYSRVKGAIMAFITVAQTGDVPPGKGKQVSVNGKTVALFNVNGTFYALDNECPHRGGPLAEGEIEANHVVCPWHAASFDLATGAVLGPPARTSVKAYKVQVVGSDVQIEA